MPQHALIHMHPLKPCVNALNEFVHQAIFCNFHAEYSPLAIYLPTRRLQSLFKSIIPTVSLYCAFFALPLRGRPSRLRSVRSPSASHLLALMSWITLIHCLPSIIGAEMMARIQGTVESILFALDAQLANSHNIERVSSYLPCHLHSTGRPRTCEYHRGLGGRRCANHKGGRSLRVLEERG